MMAVFILLIETVLNSFLLEIDGIKLPACNFVNRDEKGRIWISVSTWARNRDESFKERNSGRNNNIGR